MMVDDVGLSLDSERRQRLLHFLKNLGQIFVTTTDDKLLNDAEKAFVIQKGRVLVYHSSAPNCPSSSFT